MLVTDRAARPQHNAEASLSSSSAPIYSPHLATLTELPLERLQGELRTTPPPHRSARVSKDRPDRCCDPCSSLPSVSGRPFLPTGPLVVDQTILKLLKPDVAVIPWSSQAPLYQGGTGRRTVGRGERLSLRRSALTPGKPLPANHMPARRSSLALPVCFRRDALVNTTNPDCD